MLQRRLNEIRAELGQFDDDFTQYAFLVELSALNPCRDPQLMTDPYLFHGCQSRVWLRTRVERGCLFMEATSDTALLRGVLYIMMELFNGCPAAEIAASDIDLLAECGIAGHFTSARTSGIRALLREIRAFCTTAQTL